MKNVKGRVGSSDRTQFGQSITTFVNVSSKKYLRIVQQQKNRTTDLQ